MYLPTKLTLARAAESFSLTVFVIYIHTVTLAPGRDWLLPYALASILGVLATVYLLRRGLVLSRLVLGANLYFISGLLGVALEWQALNHCYATLGAAALLVWMLLVGFGATLGAKVGALGVEEVGSRRGSWCLVGACAIAAGCAIGFSTSPLWGEWLPFLAVFSLRSYLAKVSAAQQPPISASNI